MIFWIWTGAREKTSDSLKTLRLLLKLLRYMSLLLELLMVLYKLERLRKESNLLCSSVQGCCQLLKSQA
jgi:hypothetical protein